VRAGAAMTAAPDRRTPVLVTRPEPEASRTAARLEALGFAPVPAPLMTVEPLPGALDLAGVTGLVATSPRAFTGRRLPADLPVHAVGPATAAAARAAGAESVCEGPGDARDLARDLGARLGPGAGPLLYLAGARRARDLIGLLGAEGIAARRQIVYRTRPVARLPEPARAALAAPAPTVALLYSARTAATLRALAAAEGVEIAAARLYALCIGEGAARALAAARPTGLITAARPREDALFAALTALVDEETGP